MLHPHYLDTYLKYCKFRIVPAKQFHMFHIISRSKRYKYSFFFLFFDIPFKNKIIIKLVITKQIIPLIHDNFNSLTLKCIYCVIWMLFLISWGMYKPESIYFVFNLLFIKLLNILQKIPKSWLVEWFYTSTRHIPFVSTL